MTDLDQRYIIGIDLGTTNSAVAYVDLAEDESGAGKRRIRHFGVPQLVGLGEVAARSVLPSFLYLPGEHDLPAGGAALPWDDDRDYVVGEFAREQGARVPGRLVTFGQVVAQPCRRRPHGADPALGRQGGGGQSLARRRPACAISSTFARRGTPKWPATTTAKTGRFEEQIIILTVPASFDEVARELTVAAAQEAGLTRVILLEEPLAAFYAWLSTHEQDWQGIMADRSDDPGLRCRRRHHRLLHPRHLRGQKRPPL